MDGTEKDRHLEVDREINNIRAALRWATADSGDSSATRADLSMKLAGSMSRYWEARRMMEEACSWYEEAVEIAERFDHKWGIALILSNLGRCAGARGDLTRKPEYHVRSLDIRH